jgi:8-oxo-dGTP pyrophosphatase MutT (NUDIX family)
MDDDKLEENALRELKEETGYVGYKVQRLFGSHPLACDPWKSN